MPTYSIHTPSGTVDYALRRRSNKDWHFDFWWRGARFRGPTKTTELSTACSKTELEIKKTIAAGTFGHQILSESVERYLRARWPLPSEHIANTTYNDHRKRLRKFAAGDRGLQNLSAFTLDQAVALVQEYLNERKDKVSAETVSNDRRVISRFCTWLLEAPAKVPWHHNPASADRIIAPPVIRKIKRPAEAGHAAQIMKAAKNLPIFPVLVLMQSGLRPIGCCRVLWSGLHLNGKPTVEIPKEKGTNREIPLSAWAAKELKSFKKRNPPVGEDALVYPYTPTNAHKAVRLLRDSLGIPASFTQGALRRLSYRRLYQAGVSVQLAAKIMGSSPATAARHYVDLQTLDAHKEVEALSPIKRRRTSQKPSQKKKRRPR